jgi:predicted TIM-barrel fold metal-dependent hydrolase
VPRLSVRSLDANLELLRFWRWRHKLVGNYADKYLGDATFEPLWAELDRRHAVVFVQPALPLPPVAGVAGPLVDYPFDNTRTAVQLVLNGIVDRYPGVRIVLAHAGGFVPYASHRFAELAPVFRLDAAKPAAILREFPALLFRHGAVIKSGVVAKSEGFRRNRPHPVRHRLPLRTGRRRRVVHHQTGCL